MHPVSLIGRNVRLREFTPSDLSASMAAVSDDRVTEWMAFDPLSEAEQRSRLNGIVSRAATEPRQEYHLAVTSMIDDTVVGFCRLCLGGVRAAELGYAISFEHWGSGYATAAVRAMLGFGFHQLELHRIAAAIGPQNEGSIAVVKKVGFSYEGRLRDHVHANGAWRDSYLYSILADEWGDSRSPTPG